MLGGEDRSRIAVGTVRILFEEDIARVLIREFRPFFRMNLEEVFPDPLETDVLLGHARGSARG